MKLNDLHLNYTLSSLVISDCRNANAVDGPATHTETIHSNIQDIEFHCLAGLSLQAEHE